MKASARKIDSEEYILAALWPSRAKTFRGARLTMAEIDTAV